MFGVGQDASEQLSTAWLRAWLRAWLVQYFMSLHYSLDDMCVRVTASMVSALAEIPLLITKASLVQGSKGTENHRITPRSTRYPPKLEGLRKCSGIVSHY